MQRLAQSNTYPTLFSMATPETEISIVALKDTLVFDCTAKITNGIGHVYRSHATFRLPVSDAYRLQSLLNDAATSAAEISR